MGGVMEQASRAIQTNIHEDESCTTTTAVAGTKAIMSGCRENHHNAPSPPNQQQSYVFTVDHDPVQETMNLRNKNQNQQQQKRGLQDVLRFFTKPSSDDASCSSGTCSASLTNSSTTTSCCYRTALSTTASTTTAHTPLSPYSSTHSPQVVFVPLDPDRPLQDQGGRKPDIILHKLTEDILTLSRLANQYPELRDISQIKDDLFDPDFSQRTEEQGPSLPFLSSLDSNERNSLRRVYRLIEYQKDDIIVIDDPIRVQTLMDRSQIAYKLSQSLQNVRSTSGYRVSSPKYTVLLQEETNNNNNSDASGNQTKMDEDISKRLSNLQFPIIVKPLTAAGTKASHSMAVVLHNQETALPSILKTIPSICQEYHNHDGILYKVYVLGDAVSVHQRRSLPNLPCPPYSKSVVNFVEFDSQRPYPRLSSFGFCEDDVTGSSIATVPSTKKRKLNGSGPVLSPVEVEPIVEVLKETFGLELFGFDLLLTKEKVIQIVDVNYFPSYKEVHDFPVLLANYLSMRSRRSCCKEVK